MNKIQNIKSDNEGVKEMLSESGYSDKAIEYYLKKEHFGSLPDADHSTEMTGTCGDTMTFFLKMDNGKIADAKYEVMGCAGAVSSAMAVVELIKGKNLEYARSINDSDVFKLLEEIPEKKHHCIQLSVKTLHQAVDEYSAKS